MNYEAIILEYCKDLKALSTANEEVKKNKFQDLLRQLFPSANQEIGEYTQNLEKKIKIQNKKGMLTSGRIDAYFGNLIIEFERNIPQKLDEGSHQIKQYCAGLWNSEKKENRKPYIGIVTDGLNWHVFYPEMNGDKDEFSPNDINLKIKEVFNLENTESSAKYFFIFLNNLFFRLGSIDPTISNIKKDFGINSILYENIYKSLDNAFEEIKDNSEINLSYHQWQKYLSYTYGEINTTKELYLRHSYLSVLARFIVWAALTHEQNEQTPSIKLIEELISGKWFQGIGVTNLVESDFFHWITNPKIIKKVEGNWFAVLNQLRTYDLSMIKEDVLKGLYQELVDPKDRHDLGEYYTPDWLCEHTVKYLFDSYFEEKKEKKDFDKMPRLLDPTCGSGSFLRAGIHNIIDYYNKNSQNRMKGLILSEILDKVVGLDIHPLAVIIAKANYLLAIKDYIDFRSKAHINIPIYLADSLFLPEGESENVLIGKAEINIKFFNTEYKFPKDVFLSTTLFDELINFANKLAIDFANEGDKEFSTFYNILKREISKIDNIDMIANTLYLLTKDLADKIRINEDSIWSFILRNNFRPLFFKDSFDIIAGNPPWLAFNYIKEVNYQKEVKKLALEKYKLAPKEQKLMTQMELATLFLIHVSHSFLNKNGFLGFVMPRSIFNGDQHSIFRAEAWTADADVTEYWDLEDVKPLFNVPSCVVFAKKKKPVKNKIYTARFYSATLPQRDIPLSKVTNLVEYQDGKLYQSSMGSRTALSRQKIDLSKMGKSYYKGKFFQGATIVPRNFYFIQQPTEVELKHDTFFTKTDEEQRKESKPPWKEIIVEGEVEKEFLFKTALSKHILPFFVTELPSIILPVLKENNDFVIKDSQELEKLGYYNYSKWLKKVEGYWNSKTGKKSEKMNLFQRLNYHKTLTNQNPEHTFKVLYNTSGMNISAALLNIKSLNNTFYADHVTYWYNAKSEDEANFLVGILNSEIVNELIKPFQSKGLLGERHIHTKVLEVPIPEFDGSNKMHIEIVELAKIAHLTIKENYENEKIAGSLPKQRGLVRDLVKREIKGITKISKEIIGV